MRPGSPSDTPIPWQRYLQALLVFLLASLASLSLLYLHQQQRQAETDQALRQQLRQAVQRFEEEVHQAQSGNAELRRLLARGAEQAELEQLAAQLLTRHPPIVSISTTRKLRVNFIYPLQGNEALLGLDYSVNPEQMSGVERAIAQRDTVLLGPIRLVQSLNLGIVNRTPVFADEGNGELLGLVSIALSLQDTLQRAGLLDLPAGVRLALRGVDGQGEHGQIFHGEASLFRQARLLLNIHLPGGQWQLAADWPQQGLTDSRESRLLLACGQLLALVVALLWFHRRRPRSRTVFSSRPLPLRQLLLGALLLTLLPIIAIGGWLVYEHAQRAAEQISRQLADTISERSQDQLQRFFEAPRSVLALNVEQASGDLLDTQQPDALLQRLLLQLRQHPLLTFVSVGLADGQYYAGSRPPMGPDRGLRMLHARPAEQMQMHIHRVDAANRKGSLVSTGAHFDARQRPWFKAARHNGSMAWYEVYAYAIHDQEQAYATLGIGMSAPLHDSQGRFLGVATADIALPQLSGFLAELSEGTQALVFLLENDDQLLATSSTDALYRRQGEQVERLTSQTSDNPLIRAAGQALRDSGDSEGSLHLQIDGQTYHLDWRPYVLAKGPRLTQVVLLPDSQFASAMQALLHNTLYLGLAVLALGLLIALFVSDWVARPLVALNHWAAQLAAGQWQASPPQRSPVREVSDLARSLDQMARQLQQNTEQLEQRVAQRTAELQQANLQLAELSRTDALTGLGNRRHFDEILADEWARAARSGQQLALLMLDVDHFKLYNDHLGHQAGDQCLKTIASVLQSCARRAGDHVARYGGEEFAVIAADCDLARARQLGETILSVLATLGLPHPHCPLGRVSLSIGVAVRAASNQGSAGELIEQADAALYRAKQNGRNRVESDA